MFWFWQRSNDFSSAMRSPWWIERTVRLTHMTTLIRSIDCGSAALWVNLLLSVQAFADCMLCRYGQHVRHTYTNPANTKFKQRKEALCDKRFRHLNSKGPITGSTTATTAGHYDDRNNMHAFVQLNVRKSYRPTKKRDTERLYSVHWWLAV